MSNIYFTFFIFHLLFESEKEAKYLYNLIIYAHIQQEGGICIKIVQFIINLNKNKNTVHKC